MKATKCNSCNKVFSKVKVKTEQTKQDDEEKEVLFNAIEKLELDIDNFIVAKNMLSAELEFYSPSAEKLKTLICDIELWIEELHKKVNELDNARIKFLEKRALNRL